MNWKPELDELAKREALAKRMGGPDKVKRQHDAGRMTIRERVIPRNIRQGYEMRSIIETVVDRGSFFEMGQNFARSKPGSTSCARRFARRRPFGSKRSSIRSKRAR